MMVLDHYEEATSEWVLYNSWGNNAGSEQFVRVGKHDPFIINIFQVRIQSVTRYDGKDDVMGESIHRDDLLAWADISRIAVEETKELFRTDRSPTYIYVCGKTQGGKSTLIRRLTGDEGAVSGDGRESCTKTVSEYQCTGED